jgi:hypothetical protein
MASEIETVIRYDGPALADHEMDVAELAPALLALASLIQAANHKFNGDRASVRVVVNADIEQQCFQIKIKLIQDFLQMARGFLDGDMATIKDICEWVGIIGGGTLSLFKLIVALGRKQQDATVFNANAGDDSTIVQIQNLTLSLPEGTPKQVAELIRDPVLISKAKDVLKPAAAKGYDSVSFIDPVGHQKVFEATSDEVKSALSFEPPVVEEPDEDGEEATYSTGPAWVDTSHFRGTAKWALMWNGVKIDAKMPDDFLERFQNNEVLVVPNAKLLVRMKITPRVDETGNPNGPTSFVVEDVLDIELPTKAAVQTRLFDDNGSQP